MLEEESNPIVNLGEGWGSEDRESVEHIRRLDIVFLVQLPTVGNQKTKKKTNCSAFKGMECWEDISGKKGAKIIQNNGKKI